MSYNDRILQNDELVSPSIVRIVKSRRFEWAEHLDRKW
jgi:hypothetical protein